ncbi:MAG: hypothetical protein PHF86_06185 [Candidatus Nanoarchaeia archaeon]|nr:hypothetical protein [Candidatus Nanoarchaeia archaeon]
MYFCKKCNRSFNTKSGCTQHNSRCNLSIDSYDEIVKKYNSGMSINEIRQEGLISKKIIVYALRNTPKRTISESQKCSHASCKRKKSTKIGFYGFREQVQCVCGRAQEKMCSIFNQKLSKYYTEYQKQMGTWRIKRRA